MNGTNSPKRLHTANTRVRLSPTWFFIFCVLWIHACNGKRVQSSRETRLRGSHMTQLTPRGLHFNHTRRPLGFSAENGPFSRLSKRALI